MTETEWLSCGDPRTLLDHRHGWAGGRKLRLFAAACCRSAWSLVPEGVRREAVETVERHADGTATDREMRDAIAAVHRVRRKRNDLDWAVYLTARFPHMAEVVPYGNAAEVAVRMSRAVASAAFPRPGLGGELVRFRDGEMVSEFVPPDATGLAWMSARAVHLRLEADLFRDIAGNPYRPVAFDAGWRSEQAVSFAASVYEGGNFWRMPGLAVALERAGCTDEAVLNHCRGPGPHARGCWVLDLVLGRSCPTARG